MPLSSYDASVGLFMSGLRALKALLQKAETHAAANKVDPHELLDAQLAGDMQPLAAQVHWAAEGAKVAIARLLGSAAAPASAEGKSFAELEARVDATLAWMEAVGRDALEIGISRTVSIEYRGRTFTFVGDQYVVKFAIPNFYFHLTSVYAILRLKGVALTKGDFMGDLFG